MNLKREHSFNSFCVMFSRTMIGIQIFFISLFLCMCIVNGNVNNSHIKPMISMENTKLDIKNSSVLSISDPINNFLNNSNLINNNNNRTFNNNNQIWSIDNELWDGIINDCYTKPTFSCLQKNMFTYIDNSLTTKNINITNYLKFRKNSIDYNNCTVINENDKNDEIDQLEISREEKSESPIEEVTNGLYDKSMKFMITHDIDIKLPEIMFDGVTLRISPRNIEGNGAIVKLELLSKNEIENVETGRIFKKKIQKLIKSKLLLAFLALIIIIKLIKIKLFWLLPLILGVGAAKKLLLKVLLFLFPALAHIFKLCSYYHSNYHHTKYHHHHHHIDHHPSVLYHGHNHHRPVPHVPHPPGPELIFTQPPKISPAEFLHSVSPIAGNNYDSWEVSQPGIGSDYISDIHRNSQDYKPQLDDANDISSWGLGTTQYPRRNYNINTNQHDKQNFKMKNSGHLFTNGYQKNSPALAAQIAAQYESGAKILGKDNPNNQAKLREALRIQAEQKLIAQQQKILNQQPFVEDAVPVYPKDYDPFYSPILMKIDKILEPLGFIDDGCKERIVCSMYKNPNRYSPHSNFISAELSRESEELERPSTTNVAVIMFYRLIQAAQDGQDQKDCLKIYSQCTIKTE